MSASIYWKPADPEKLNRINTSTPSAFQDSMARAGLAMPCVLSKEHVPTLRGMAAMETYEPNPYQQMINAIDSHIVIEVLARS